ncbi:MAG TPA: DUF4262 domain-containing protein [Ktedonobacteraceae bacterium]|nr:DUF4262 domain-containing protein [Ktedonobacteraceae bacterium]
MHHHTHLSQHEQQQQIREGIALQGFALRHVLASADEPAYSYTVGLFTPGSQKPELVISGLSTELRVAWLLDLGFRIQGPPPLATRQHMARVHRVALDTLVFPEGGAVFEPGKCYRDLAENQMPTWFAQIASERYHTHLGQAIVFHGSSPFPVLQVVWPDPHGFFPWQASFDLRFVGTQRLLFDQQHQMYRGADAIPTDQTGKARLT